MLDEILDREPVQLRFARFLRTPLDPAEAATATARWAQHWHDREGLWTNLRDLAHWIERSADSR